MKRLTPIGALLLCWLFGIIIGKPGLWFSIGILALMGVAALQHQQGRTRR